MTSIKFYVVQFIENGEVVSVNPHAWRRGEAEAYAEQARRSGQDVRIAEVECNLPTEPLPAKIYSCDSCSRLSEASAR